MSRTVSARISKEMHDELRERCNKVGCSINDFLQESLETALNDYSEIDTETKPTQPEPTITIRDVDEPLEFSVKDGNLYVDGNFYGKCSDFSLTDGKVYDEYGNLIGQISH